MVPVSYTHLVFNLAIIFSTGFSYGLTPIVGGPVSYTHLNEPQVTLEVGDEKQLIVSMGNFSSNDELSFTVEDETIVSMVNTDVFRPFYTLTGLKSGHTTVTFTDHKGKQAIVQVTVNPISIDVSNLAPRVGVNNKVMITVEKGNGGYTLTAEDETIVDIQQLDDTHFNLVGKKAGVTTMPVSYTHLE